MKLRPAFTSLLALSALLLTAQAQTLATPHNNPTPAKPADHRAATYQGPKVVSDSRALGKKMVRKSKPADAVLMRRSDLPVKK